MSFNKLGVKQSNTYPISGAYLGSWKFIIATQTIHLDPVLYDFMELSGDTELSIEQFVEQIAADDRQIFVQCITNLSQSLETTSLEILLHSDPKVNQKIRVAAKSFADKLGLVQGISGAFLAAVHQENPSVGNYATDQTTDNNPDIITRWDKQFRLTFANPAFASKAGAPLGDLLGKTILEMPQADQIALPFMQALQLVFDRELPTEHHTCFQDSQGSIYYHSHITPEFDADGNIQSALAVARDISDLKQQEVLLLQSEQRFNDLIHQAPVATCLFTGPDMVVEIANDLMIGFWGKDRSVIGQPLEKAVPELIGQPFLQILDQVYKTGKAFEQKSAPASLLVDGRLSTFYFDYTYKPLFDSEGKVYGIVDMAVDVTEQTIHLQNLQASEQRFRSMIESAPAAVGLFIGPDLIVESPNQGFIDIIGKGPDIAGRKLIDLMPELEKQDFIRLLETVYYTGEPFHASEAPLDLTIDGISHRRYFNISFTPLRDAQQRVYGILDISVDVTKAVDASKKVKLAETSLRNVVEMAELGTWTADIRTRTIELSPRLKQWYGLAAGATVNLDTVISMIDHDDFVASSWSLKKLPMAASGFSSYDTRYRIKAADGMQRTLRDQGKMWFDEQGNLVTVTGSVQDITDQVLQTDMLLQKIESAQGELSESNRDLKRSDANLLQFAYVASHDLQEPLRKIQTFAGLLRTQYSEKLGEGNIHLGRIELAAQRMSDLVKDLLQFSEITTSQQKSDVVDLGQLISQVLGDLDMNIDDNHAQITVAKLPSVRGDHSQLSQLFNNLISNALKFHKTDLVPVIHIRCETISKEQLPQGFFISRQSDHYYCIEVADQGIGFDQAHAERIFQVFQRLHSKSEFAGTGIGLAICEKVAANHGGSIRANSTPGQGSIFSVYLPV